MLAFEPSAEFRARSAAKFQRKTFSSLIRAAACCAIGVVALCSCGVLAETTPLSQQMAQSVMRNWPDGHWSADQGEWKWDYRLGIVLDGMDAVWHNDPDPAYYDYVKQAVDQFVAPDGSIRTYDPQAQSLDNILLGRQLLLLYGVTQDAKYYKAATILRRQLATQQRNASGGFWHQGQLPDQMWLDGLYMAEPFYAEYASMFHEPQDFADITRQFSLLDRHARDPKTGLLYHAWDESKKEAWANQITGDSPVFWGRATGWYMMALVETLPYYKRDDPGRATLLAILNRTAEAVAKVQDPKTGLWYQVLDKPEAKGNYLESSASCMFTYAFAKGVRLGYLPAKYESNAFRGYRGILHRFVQNNPDGSLAISDTSVGTLVGTGYSYYIARPKSSNEPHGVGAFLLASSEMELAPIAQTGHGATVLLDAWFNSQQRTNAAGQQEYFHYKWNDRSNSGFSFFGHMFRSYGVSTATLYTAPSLQNLKQAQFYIIVSPDIPSKNPHPHYLQPKDAVQVAEWVRQGGVLVLMENDPANADIDHLDLLADKFGIHFNDVLFNHVVGDDIEHGRVATSGNLPVFPGSHIFYMKDTCTISMRGSAVPSVRKDGNVMMAVAKYGKGTVFAVVDPWLYNEYVDGHNHNLPSEYDNFTGGKELVRWLIEQLPVVQPSPMKHSVRK
ncbi:MAG: glycoside hydrolase family 88 protein [Acidobacteriaceae bacterium]